MTPSLPHGLRLLQRLHRPLASSVADQLRSTTDPLTSNLVAIRSGLADLADYVRSRDAFTAGAREREGLELEAEAVKRDMAEAAQLTRRANQSTAGHFRALNETLQQVLAVNRQILDLSERINVLSINASIEAARAGNAGRGFKVIANEVKALARETTDYLDQVERTLKGAQGLFDAVDRDLDARGNVVETVLTKQERSFVALQGRYLDQGARFSDLCRTIGESMVRLDAQVSRISPLVQLHEVSVQELENLAAVTDDALAEVPPAPAGPQDPGEILAWAHLVRERLTTAEELRILDGVLVSLGVGPLGGGAPAAGALELF